MARPRNADAELTKQRILDAAIERFGAHGLRETSLRTIAADAGVTFATVHHYFGCKSELFARCLEAGYAHLADLPPALGETLTETEGGLDVKLAAVARRAFHFARERSAVSRLLLRAMLYEDAATERARRAQQQYLDVASALLAPVVGRTQEDLRVPLQGLMILLTRMAVMSDAELVIIGGGRDPERTKDELAAYVATVAVRTLSAEPGTRVPAATSERRRDLGRPARSAPEQI